MKSQKVCSLYVWSAALLVSLLVAPAWGYEKEMEALSSAMAAKIASKGKKTVAVVDFTDLEGNVTQLDRLIAEEFSVALAGAGKGFQVIDRTNLNSIIKEHKLSTTGLIDLQTAKKLGKIIGVDALVTGTVTPFGDNMRVTIKILDAETAQVIDGLTDNLGKTEAMDKLQGTGVAAASTVENGSKKRETKPAQAKKDKGGNSNAFSDDFEAGPKPDWKPIVGNWTMSNGQYTITDVEQNTIYTTFLDEKKWSNFTMEIDVTPGYSNQFGGESCRMTICPRFISSKEKVCFGMSGRDYKFKEAYWFIVKDGSNGEDTSRVSLETPEEKPVHVKIEVKDGVFTSYVNGTQINKIYDTTFSSGSIGLSQWYKYWDGQKIRMTFDNLEIKPLAD